MVTRRTSTKTATTIDPVSVTALALKQIKTAIDYSRISRANTETVVDQAWNRLSESEQQRISDIIENDVQPTPEVIADELAASGSKLELEALKSNYGEIAIKAAWWLLPQRERDRIKALCECESQPQPTEETTPMTEQPSVHKVESTPTLAKRNLIELTSDLQQLDQLLDTIDGDIPVDLQTAVDDLLTQREHTHEALLEKLDNYAALIQSRLMWATSRKAEADRLARLAESDYKTVDFLKGRLKEHLESTDQRKLRTKRFNIAVCQNGGKTALRFDDTTPDQMPERFQRVQVEVDREAIRTALEAGEDLGFAYLAEREYHLRIK